MKVEKISTSVLVLTEGNNKYIRTGAMFIGIIGIIMTFVLSSHVLGLIVFGFGSIGVIANGFSTEVKIDKRRKELIHSRYFFYIPIFSDWIELDEVERVEWVPFLSIEDKGRASDEYFQRAKQVVKDKDVSLQVYYNLGIRNGVGNWRILCKGDNNKGQYAQAASEVKLFLEDSTLFAA